MRFQTGGLHYKLGVSLVSRTFANCDACRAKVKEASGSRPDERGVRVDGFWQVLYEIRLEKDRFAGDIQPEQPQSIEKECL